MKLRYQMRGLGVGIIVTALVLGVAGKDGLPLSDAEIRERALELGMVDGGNRKLTDLQDADGESETPSGAEGEPGMSSVPEGEAESESGASSVPDGEPETPSGADNGAEHSPAPGGEPGTSSVPEGETESESGVSSVLEGEGRTGTSSVPEGETEGGEASSAVDADGENDGMPGPQDVEAGTENVRGPGAGDKVSVVIEPGINSGQVCTLLAEAGLVGDADKLDRYLCENGYSTSIRHGVYEFAAGISEEEIVRILTGGKTGQAQGAAE